VTIYMNFRQLTVSGGTKDPTFLEADGTVAAPALTALQEQQVRARSAKRHVLFATHGFNVNMADGVCALGRLEAALALPTNALFIAVLWPGDFWLPVINYPFEGAVSMDCGRRLAKFCNQKLSDAASLSFVSHSLGARVMLEAVRNLDRKARSVCLTAGAVNDDCLTTQYSTSFKNASVVSVLASRRDLVLMLAYPIGDPIANLLHFDHKPLEVALGYSGPAQAVGATVPPWQIPNDAGFDHTGYSHGDYLPPSDAAAALPPDAKWRSSVAFMKRAFNGEPQTWP
jgi:esterase/lipase superfamily enzyme